MNLFREVTSENGIDELIMLSKDELCLLPHRLEHLSPALSDLEIADVQSLQFYVKKIFKKMELTRSIENLNTVPLEVKCFRTSRKEIKEL